MKSACDRVFRDRSSQWALLGTALGGCTSFVRSQLPAESAGHVGCARQEVEIIDPHVGLNRASWTAQCRGTRYHCELTTIASGVTQTACAPEPGQAAPITAGSAANDGQCHFDTQCKGTRICEDGRCVGDKPR